MSQGLNTTADLSQWVHSLQLSDVPKEVVDRVKYLMLDGLGCAIIGSHLPWSEAGAQAVFSMESEGSCSIWGYEKKIGPLPAALLNSSFIQGFELDDYHSEAPIHSSSIVLPALFALAQHLDLSPTSARFLLAATVGYELGPRIGLGLGGAAILSRGWHSGVVFGHAAAALACSKLMDLSPTQMEDAVAIACTQACGLMSAQYGSMVKRMQHGFAARNGLFAAIMAAQGYTGMKGVLELPYGGFYSAFGQGGPPVTPNRVTDSLSKDWEIMNIVVKPYASMAATHGTIDCVRAMNSEHPEAFNDINAIDEIIVQMSDPAFKKGGWAPTRPVDSTSAQMSGPYAAASQIVDGNVLAAQFSPTALDRDLVWAWIDKIRCVHEPKFDTDKDFGWHQHMTIKFKDAAKGDLQVFVPAPRGVKPPLTNDEVAEKWEALTQGVIDVDLRDTIQRAVLTLDIDDHFSDLLEMMAKPITRLAGFRHV